MRIPKHKLEIAGKKFWIVRENSLNRDVKSCSYLFFIPLWKQAYIVYCAITNSARLDQVILIVFNASSDLWGSQTTLYFHRLSFIRMQIWETENSSSCKLCCIQSSSLINLQICITWWCMTNRLLIHHSMKFIWIKSTQTLNLQDYSIEVIWSRLHMFTFWMHFMWNYAFFQKDITVCDFILSVEMLRTQSLAWP